jgi:PAS domain S-box-containing protein
MHADFAARPAPAALRPTVAPSAPLRQAWVDLGLVALITVATFALGGALEFSEWLAAHSKTYEAYQLDELPLTLAAMLLGLTWYSWRRHRHASAEMGLRLRTQAALVENQRHYRMLFTEDLSANMLADADGVVSLANPEAARLLGLDTPEVAVGRRIGDFYADAALWQAHRARLLEGGKLETPVLTLRRPDGAERRVIAKLTLRQDANGASQVHAFFTDITALEQAQAQLARTLAENRQLIQRSIQVQEDERRHIARELHDEMGQWLNALKLDAVSIRDRAEGEIKAAAQSIVEVTNHVYDVARNLMRRLRPVALDELGLASALQYLVDQWMRRHPGVRCNFEADGSLDELGEVINITLYRFVQECLTNVAKHAGAGTVTIRLSRDGARQRVAVAVADDGRGIDPARAVLGMGLLGLRERIEVLGGEFFLESDGGRGLRVRAVMPA